MDANDLNREKVKGIKLRLHLGRKERTSSHLTPPSSMLCQLSFNLQHSGGASIVGWGGTTLGWNFVTTKPINPGPGSSLWRASHDGQATVPSNSALINLRSHQSFLKFSRKASSEHLSPRSRTNPLLAEHSRVSLRQTSCERRRIAPWWP